MKRLLLFTALLFLVGCNATLGPGDAWYTYHNDRNDFARLEIDGRINGPTYRPYDSRKIPLATARPHTIAVSHGIYTELMNTYGDMHLGYDVKSVDPPYTIYWTRPDGWTTSSPSPR
jgi:hypothetical protein